MYAGGVYNEPDCQPRYLPVGYGYIYVGWSGIFYQSTGQRYAYGKHGRWQPNVQCALHKSV